VQSGASCERWRVTWDGVGGGGGGGGDRDDGDGNDDDCRGGGSGVGRDTYCGSFSSQSAQRLFSSCFCTALSVFISLSW
jgi:hypothetical protein